MVVRSRSIDERNDTQTQKHAHLYQEMMYRRFLELLSALKAPAAAASVVEETYTHSNHTYNGNALVRLIFEGVRQPYIRVHRL